MSVPPSSKPEGATTIFILGLLGLFVCFPLAIVAWIMGNRYMEECRTRGVEPEGIAVAGRVMGMIAVGLFVIGLILVVILAIAGGLAGGRVGP